MKCQCGGDTIVKDSRYGDGYQWRRRECKECEAQFNTEESICEITNVKKGMPFRNGVGHAPKKHVRIPVKPRAPKVKVDKPAPAVVAVKPVVVKPKAPKEKPVVREAPAPAPVPAWKRIEDMKMEREYDLM